MSPGVVIGMWLCIMLPMTWQKCSCISEYYNYCIARNFRGSQLLRIHPKIIFADLIFANFIIQPFCTVLFIILRILFLQISKNCEKSESYWPWKFPAIQYLNIHYHFISITQTLYQTLPYHQPQQHGQKMNQIIILTGFLFVLLVAFSVAHFQTYPENKVLWSFCFHWKVYNYSHTLPIIKNTIKFKLCVLINLTMW